MVLCPSMWCGRGLQKPPALVQAGGFAMMSEAESSSGDAERPGYQAHNLETRVQIPPLPPKSTYLQGVSMKIHELEYLPVDHIWVTSEKLSHVEVSLYGHWCHIKAPDGAILSVPVSAVARIEWAIPTEPRF